MIKRVFVFILCFFTLFLALNGCTISSREKSKEVIRAEELLSVGFPHRDLILDEVESGYISARDIELYLYMEERFEYYIKIDGEYIISKHDDLVIKEAAEKFNLSEEEVNIIHYNVGNLMVGIKPKDEIKLDDDSIPVVLSIDKVELSEQKELIVTVTNSTNYDGELPMINMTFNLYKGDENVSFQVVWAENFKKGTSSFKSLPISEEFDSFDCVAYMNIDNMKSLNLKSSIQSANDKGETVIPVYIMSKTDLE